MRFRADSRPRCLSDRRWVIAVLRIDKNNASHIFEVYIPSEGVRVIEQQALDEAKDLIKPDISSWVGMAHQILDWRVPEFVESWCKEQAEADISAAIKGNKSLEISLQAVKKVFGEAK